MQKTSPPHFTPPHSQKTSTALHTTPPHEAFLVLHRAKCFSDVLSHGGSSCQNNSSSCNSLALGRLLVACVKSVHRAWELWHAISTLRLLLQKCWDTRAFWSVSHGMRHSLRSCAHQGALRHGIDAAQIDALEPNARRIR